ncbi:MAG TPA: Gfo/Idh/MocA family oxidoreductase [Candidatus Limnocylindria bacterium]
MALIGAGLMGGRHAENVAKLDEARLVAVCDPDADRAERLARDLDAVRVPSVDELVGSDDVRAVIVASPAPLHEDHAIAAARAGKDVFLEKPMATSLAGADRVIAAARAASVRLQIGFQRRFDPAYADARRRIRAGDLGRPLFYRGVNRDRDAPVGAPGSMDPNDILTESAIHDLDGACWMLDDDVVGVSASLATIGPAARSPGPDVALVELRFARGAVAEIETLRGATYAYDIRSEIVCEQGAIIVGGFAQTMLTVMRGGDRRDDLYPGFLERYEKAYAAELRDFVGGIRERRPVAVSGEDGRRALGLALAAGRAAASRVEVVPDVGSRV